MIRFRVLGTLAVRCRGENDFAEVPGMRRRVLLAVLLLNARHTIPIHQLVDVVWPQAPPERSDNALQAHVARLRRELDGRLGPGEGLRRIMRNNAGYTMTVHDGELDLAAFDAMQRSARARAADAPADAADELRQSLALWHGPALADVRECSSRLEATAVKAEEDRLLAIEELIDLNLRLGHHDRIIGELRALTSLHPLRERFYEQLIVALGKAGRCVEAAKIFREARKHLITEFGLEPSQSLNRTIEDTLSD